MTIPCNNPRLTYACNIMRAQDRLLRSIADYQSQAAEDHATPRAITAISGRTFPVTETPAGAVPVAARAVGGME